MERQWGIKTVPGPVVKSPRNGVNENARHQLGDARNDRPDLDHKPHLHQAQNKESQQHPTIEFSIALTASCGHILVPASHSRPTQRRRARTLTANGRLAGPPPALQPHPSPCPLCRSRDAQLAAIEHSHATRLAAVDVERRRARTELLDEFCRARDALLGGGEVVRSRQLARSISMGQIRGCAAGVMTTTVAAREHRYGVVCRRYLRRGEEVDEWVKRRTDELDRWLVLEMERIEDEWRRWIQAIEPDDGETLAPLEPQHTRRTRT